MKKETSQLLIKGYNTMWYLRKNSCIEHLCLIGTGSNVHKKAMDEYNRHLLVEKQSLTAAKNVFRSVIVDLKLGAAGQHVEMLISFSALCSVNVSSIGHGRKNFKDILNCLEDTVNGKITKLSSPLPSTTVPPHYWAMVDKSTPRRTTNQATLIVARDDQGIPNPVPVSAPSVYLEVEAASYENLAKMLLKAIEEKFSRDLSRLCGVAADGPYQTSGFRRKLLEYLGIEDNNLALPITWDAAHVLNLELLDVKDADTASGVYTLKNLLSAATCLIPFLQMVKSLPFSISSILLHENLSRMLVKGLLVPLLNSG